MPKSDRPTIMLVESEPMLRLTMSKFLRRSDYDVTACPDVRAAAAALAETSSRPSLIVLGTRVLNHEAADTARRLRELAPGIPMLGIADVLQHDGGETPTLPDNLRFLAPPFDMPDVLRAVRSSLRQAGVGTAVELEA